MPKSARKPSPKSTAAEAAVAKSSQATSSNSDGTGKAATGSKQARVIAMLKAPDGVTIAAMMKVTGWQQHSVRGFLAGVVRKKLKAKLDSRKLDGDRVYRIDAGNSGKASSRQSKRRSA